MLVPKWALLPNGIPAISALLCPPILRPPGAIVAISIPGQVGIYSTVYYTTKIKHPHPPKSKLKELHCYKDLDFETIYILI